MNVLSYSYAGQKSEISFTELKASCQQAYVLYIGPKNTISSVFHILEFIYIP